MGGGGGRRRGWGLARAAWAQLLGDPRGAWVSSCLEHLLQLGHWKMPTLRAGFRGRRSGAALGGYTLNKHPDSDKRRTGRRPGGSAHARQGTTPLAACRVSPARFPCDAPGAGGAV